MVIDVDFCTSSGQWHCGDVLQSNIIFCDICCFRSASWWRMSSLNGVVNCQDFYNNYSKHCLLYWIYKSISKCELNQTGTPTYKTNNCISFHEQKSTIKIRNRIGTVVSAEYLSAVTPSPGCECASMSCRAAWDRPSWRVESRGSSDSEPWVDYQAQTSAMLKTSSSSMKRLSWCLVRKLQGHVTKLYVTIHCSCSSSSSSSSTRHSRQPCWQQHIVVVATVVVVVVVVTVVVVVVVVVVAVVLPGTNTSHADNYSTL